MNTVSHEEQGNSTMTQMKHKLINNAKEETHSFLSFSRENLGILHTDLDCGYEKSHLRVKKNTILSVVALIVALLCLVLELWKFKCILTNSRDIELLKRDVQILKHRFSNDDLEQLREQLYADSINGEDEVNNTDMENADYYVDYENEEEEQDQEEDDDKIPLSTQSNTYKNIPLMYGSKFSDVREIIHQLQRNHPDFNLNEYLLPRSDGTDDESKREEKNIDEILTQDGVMIDQNIEPNKKIDAPLKIKDDKESPSNQINRTKQKRAAIRQKFEPIKVDLFDQVEEDRMTQKRATDSFANNQSETTTNAVPDERVIQKFSHVDSKHNRRTNTIESQHYRRINLTDMKSSHPPKKYHSRGRLEAIRELFLSQRDPSIDSLIRGRDETMIRRDVGRSRSNWRDTELLDEETHQSNQSSEEKSDSAKRVGIGRKNLRVPRPVYAIHYGADSTLFTSEDEHKGNGKARHNEGVFKAWKATDWATDFGMNKVFSLANDGRLTVREGGLYLVYAQIHYLDEHDENGFHVLVNGRPILQCMVYSPGTGHKSRSCFSAQVIFLQSGNHLMVKDVGLARYTLFQSDKSFFGLVKLGDLRQVQTQSQRHQSQL